MANNLIKKTPKILVISDRKRELALILKFLNHPEFPQHRQMILKALPELNDFILKSKNEKIAVKNFTDEFYSKNKAKITSALKEIKLEVKSNSIALKALGESMNYKWKDNLSYTAIPTILPFSPFNKNIFYFSILDRIMDVGKKNIIETAVHEISHFIFFDYLKKIEKKEGFILLRDTKYYLKETLTAALFNEEPLRTTFKIDNYIGNPDIRDIFIMDENKKVKTFIEYTREEYNKNKENNWNFKDFLNSYVISMHKLSDEFSKKRLIWNRYGKEIFGNKTALDIYRKPIKLIK